MLRQLLLASVLLGGTATTSVAQSNFRPGYILPTAGDTLRGEIDARGDQRNARLCRFRPAAGPETDYTPEELRGYGFSNGRHFETAKLPTAVGLPISLWAEPLAFVERLAQGAASLYYLRDAKDAEHFYLRSTPEGQLQELTQTTTMVNQDGSRYRSTDKAYLRTLSQAFQACPTMQASLSGVTLTVGSLTKAVARYNTCIGPEAGTPNTNKPANKLRIKLLAGVEKASLSFDGATVFHNQSFGSSVAPAYGIALVINPRAINRNVSISLEAIYSTYKAHGTSLGSYNNSLYGKEQEASFDMGHVRLPLLLRYTYSQGIIQPFVSAGAEFGIFTKQNGKFRYRFSPGSGEYTQWRPMQENFETRKVEQSLLAGVGLTTARPGVRSASIEMRVSRSNGFSKVSGVGSSFTRFTALLAVDLMK